MSDEERCVPWIDYIIASDDPADKALAKEYIARQWAYSQLMRSFRQELRPGGKADEVMAKLDEEQTLSDALQERVYRRGEELHASGAAPADEDFAEAWHNQWRSISPTLPSDEDEIARA